MAPIVFLHGFLGSSADWFLVERELRSGSPEVNLWAPDLFAASDGRGPWDISPRLDFSQWTQNFLAVVEERFGGQRPWLVGYSLGARLALHAALARPERWEGVLLLAANPGLWDAGAVEQRRTWELQWARRFAEDSWSEVLETWNQQAVFTGTSPRVPPREDRFDRELLSLSFKNWSLTRHTFTEAELRAQAGAGWQWWFGSRDEKFLGVKDWLERHNIPGVRRVLEGVGHRIPLDAPSDIATLLRYQVPF